MFISEFSRFEKVGYIRDCVEIGLELIDSFMFF